VLSVKQKMNMKFPATKDGCVSKHNKLLLQVLSGTADANISFLELCALMQHLGFAVRIRGSHHIFIRNGVEEILNLQPRGHSAKPYQVRQVRAVILKYRLGGDLNAQI